MTCEQCGQPMQQTRHRPGENYFCARCDLHVFSEEYRRVYARELLEAQARAAANTMEATLWRYSDDQLRRLVDLARESA